MNERQRAGLAQIADLLRDRELAELRAAVSRIAAAQALRDSLAAPATDDLPELAAARAALCYEVWADRRRQEIDRRMTTLMAELHRKQAAAAQAFGRSQVLERLGRPQRR